LHDYLCWATLFHVNVDHKLTREKVVFELRT